MHFLCCLNTQDDGGASHLLTVARLQAALVMTEEVLFAWTAIC